MRSPRHLALALALVAVPAAYAGQTFSFSNPVPNATFSTAMFNTTGVYQGFPVGSILNLYTGSVDFVVNTYDDVTLGRVEKRQTAYYVLSGYNGSTQGGTANESLGSTILSNTNAVDPGTLTFYDSPTARTPNNVLLEIDFASANQSRGGLSAADGPGQELDFSGSLLTTGQRDNSRFNFTFAGDLFDPTDPSYDPQRLDRYTGPVNYTSTFTASIGVVPVPEPTTLAAFALGGFALLRRRRRA